MLPLSGGKLEALEREIKRAGFYQPNASQQFLALRNGLLISWLLYAAVVFVAAEELLPVSRTTFGITTLIVGLFLYAIPRLYLQTLSARRTRNIQNDLPDALDMLSMCLTGGLSLQQALERVGKELWESHRDVAAEFKILRRQAETHTLERALNQLSERVDISEVKSLASLIAQTERLGTNVSGALQDFADGMRRSHRQRAEERGNKASVQLMLPVTFCLAPPIYILLLAPALLELREFVVRENEPGGVLAPADEFPQL